MTGTRITAIEAVVVAAPSAESANSGRTVVVRVDSDAGVSGYGEGNANTDGVLAMLSSASGYGQGWDATIAEAVVGVSATDPAAVWERFQATSFWSHRAGVGHVAAAGVDMALWDLAGKLIGVPVWKLLGADTPRCVQPYVTIYHGTHDFADTLARSLDAIDWALDNGYRAVKVEALDTTAPEPAHIVELTERARERIGPDRTLLLDVGYRWRSFEEMAGLVDALDACDLFALEAPFQAHLVDEYLKLAGAMRTPIATGDMLTAGLEFLPLRGVVNYLQCGGCRTGISDMRAMLRSGLTLIPWGWVPTALTVNANLQVASAHDAVPLIEHAPCDLYPDAVLRRQIAGPEPKLIDGMFQAPSGPGLGVEVDVEAVRRLRVG